MSLSVVLVLVCSLPSVTHPRPTGVHSSAPGVMSEIDTFVSPMGNFNIITLDHLLKNNAIAGNTKHFDDEMDLAGSVGLDGMKVHNIVQTFVYVPVDPKHYASDSFAFVNDQAEQFRRCWRQFQAGKKDVYLLPESSIRRWRHCTFLHSVEVLERTFVYVAVDSKHFWSYGQDVHARMTGLSCD